MTKEQEKISAINKKNAWDYFVSIGEIPDGASKQRYNLHHIDPSWRHNDIERYIQWNIDDLIVLTVSEHTKLHWQYNYDERCKHISDSLKGRHWTEEAKKKMSETRKGQFTGEKHPFYGKHHSEDTKKKIGETFKKNYVKENHPNYGKHFSDEMKTKMSMAKRGRHWYTNGVLDTLTYECPSGYWKGRTNL